MKYSDLALQVATKAHQGQKDKAGIDYINHPITVASMVDTDIEKAVAYLHDVVEDTDITFTDLENLGFPKEIIDAVKCITRKSNETYEEYLNRVLKNPIALRVKIADMTHNSDISRIPNPSDKDRIRCNKYEAKLKYLRNHIYNNKKSYTYDK